MRKRNAREALVVDVDGDGDAFGSGFESGEWRLLVSDDEGRVASGGGCWYQEESNECLDQRISDKRCHDLPEPMISFFIYLFIFF